ncbi:hypothetical protein EON67_05300 [archaeon]|nr:MAG: hypothetical protein EON67_05300 [archaeon]
MCARCGGALNALVAQPSATAPPPCTALQNDAKRDRAAAKAEAENATRLRLEADIERLTADLIAAKADKDSVEAHIQRYRRVRERNNIVPNIPRVRLRVRAALRQARGRVYRTVPRLCPCV